MKVIKARAPQSPGRFRISDLLTEASHGIGARPGRLLLTILGTVLGIGALVVTLGMAATSAGQVARKFDAIAATQVVIKPETTRGPAGERAIGRLPWDSPERINRLNGVVAAALLAPVETSGAQISAVPITDPTATATVAPSVVAASAQLIETLRADLGTGRFFDVGHDERRDRVAVLGADAAQRLGINRIDAQPSIFIGTDAYTVIGIIEEFSSRRDLANAVIIPIGTARDEFGLETAAEVQVRIEIGAGPLLNQQAPIALAPNSPESIQVQAPRQSNDLQDSVQSDLDAVFLVLGAVALLVGGLGIANVTLLSVMERVGEIGLRRALGATRRQIGAQFVVESVVIGLLGGLLGAALGVFVVVGWSALREWTPVLDLWLALGAALLGGVIGLLAGAYPALKAASLEPVAALRGGL
ncbi:MAG: ABC transporter permease [Beutenbergiaceae bacterium]